MRRQEPQCGSLGEFWSARRGDVVKGAYQKPVTQKEHGQLKYLERCLGPRTRPVIAYAVQNWWKFAAKAQAVAGLSTFPTEPHIGFLLKHHGVAMALADSLSAGAQVTPASSKSLVSNAAPVIAPEPPHVLTKEELVEMLAGLKE